MLFASPPLPSGRPWSQFRLIFLHLRSFLTILPAAKKVWTLDCTHSFCVGSQTKDYRGKPWAGFPGERRLKKGDSSVSEHCSGLVYTVSPDCFFRRHVPCAGCSPSTTPLEGGSRASCQGTGSQQGPGCSAAYCAVKERGSGDCNGASGTGSGAGADDW